MTTTNSELFFSVFDPETATRDYLSLTVYGSKDVRDSEVERSYQSPTPGCYLSVTEDTARELLEDKIVNVAIWEDAEAPEWVAESPYFVRADEDILGACSGHNDHIKAMFLRA